MTAVLTYIGNGGENTRNSFIELSVVRLKGGTIFKTVEWLI